VALGVIAVVGGLLLGGATLGVTTYQGAKRGEPWFPGKDMLQEPGAQIATAAVIIGAMILLLGSRK
jgi:hypothetical protein